MEDLFSRVIEDLVGRVSGPMKFRLILQPVMAAIFAIRSGLKDAKGNKPPYFWAIFTNSDSRLDMIRDGGNPWDGSSSSGSSWMRSTSLLSFDGFTQWKPLWLPPSWLLYRIC